MIYLWPDLTQSCELGSVWGLGCCFSLNKVGLNLRALILGKAMVQR